MSEPTKAVFLSYASQDAEAAKKICDALRAVGVEVWFDQNELVGGDSWDQKIRGQIGSCALFVPVVSAATQARREGYFRLEWKLAAQRTYMIADGTPFLLPVVIDGTRDAEALVPAEFKAVQWTRLGSAESIEDVRVATFCARVGKLLHGTAPSTPTASSTDSTPRSKSGVSARPRGTAGSPQRWRAATVAALVLGLGAALFWSWQRNARARRVHDTVLPQIERLIVAKNLGGAFALAVAAERDAPDDSALKALWPRIAVTTSIETTPAGADVFVKD